MWYQDVHLRALRTDNGTVQGILAQVDLAALCLIDGNGGNSSQHLETVSSLLAGVCGAAFTLEKHERFQMCFDVKVWPAMSQ